VTKTFGKGSLSPKQYMKLLLANLDEASSILKLHSMEAKVLDMLARAHPVQGQGEAEPSTRTDHKENTNDRQGRSPRRSRTGTKDRSH
jgi:hypothetical protein